MATPEEREYVRRLLLDAAAQFHEKQLSTELVVNRIGTFTSPETALTVYLRPRATAFAKMRLTTDTGSGTNWVASNTYFTYNEFTGVFMFLDVSPTLPSAGDNVNVTYMVENGLDDETIDQHVDLGKLLVNKWTNQSFSFDKSTDDESLAYSAAMYFSAWGLILTSSGVNLLMEGINYRLGDLEVQTKTWGEGMIAQPLFEMYYKQVKTFLDLLYKVPFKRTGRKARDIKTPAVDMYYNIRRYI